MEWQGVDWVVPLFELAAVLMPVASVVIHVRRVRDGRLGKGRALLRHALLVLAPVVAYALFMALLIGLEELTRQPLIGDGLARSFILLVAAGLALGLVSSLILALVLAFVRRRPGTGRPGS